MKKKRKKVEKTRIFTNMNITDPETPQGQLLLNLHVYDEHENERLLTFPSNYNLDVEDPLFHDWADQFASNLAVQAWLKDKPEGYPIAEFFLYLAIRQLCSINKWKGFISLQHHNRDFRTWGWERIGLLTYHIHKVKKNFAHPIISDMIEQIDKRNRK